DPLAGARNERDRLNDVLKPRAVGPRHAPEHLERQLRQPIAKLGDLKVVEDHVSRATISWRVGASLDAFNERVRRLIGGAPMQAHGVAAHIERLAVRPDAADAIDHTFAKPHRKIRIIGVSGRLDRSSAAAETLSTATAARFGLGHLLELGRPDDLSGDTHAAGDLRNRRAFGRSLDLQIVEARAFLLLRTGTEKLRIDVASGDRR